MPRFRLTCVSVASREPILHFNRSIKTDTDFSCQMRCMVRTENQMTRLGIWPNRAVYVLPRPVCPTGVNRVETQENRPTTRRLMRRGCVAAAVVSPPTVTICDQFGTNFTESVRIETNRKHKLILTNNPANHYVSFASLLGPIW